MELRKVLVVGVAIYAALLICAWAFWTWYRSAVREAFIETVQILNRAKIPYYVYFGTLLGIHREKDVIIGDNDADVCVPLEYAQDLEKALQAQKGLKWGKFKWGAYRTYCRGATVDIFLTKKLNDNEIEIPSEQRLYSPDLIYPLQTLKVDFGGTKIKINQPAKWEENLDFIYGKDWRVPLRKWYKFYLQIF